MIKITIESKADVLTHRMGKTVIQDEDTLIEISGEPVQARAEAVFIRDKRGREIWTVEYLPGVVIPNVKWEGLKARFYADSLAKFLNGYEP